MNEIASTAFISFLGGLSAAIITHAFTIISDRTSRKRKIFDDLFGELETIIVKCIELSAVVWGAKGATKPLEEQELVCQIHDISTIVSFLELKGAKTHRQLSA